MEWPGSVKPTYTHHAMRAHAYPNFILKICVHAVQLCILYLDSHYPAPYHSILYHTWTVNSPQNTILQRTPKLTPINININKMQIKQKYRKKKDGEIQKCNSLTGSSGSCCHLPNLIFSAGCTINTSTPAQTHRPYHHFSSLLLIFTRLFSPFFPQAFQPTR